MKQVLFFAALLSLTACTQSTKKTSDSNMNLDYLVAIESPAVSKFIDAENTLTKNRLEKDPRFNDLQEGLFNIVTAKDKMPGIQIEGDYVYDFWQDQTSVQGLFRRTTVAQFNLGKPNWEIVLDLDALSKKENENWAWKGFTCLQPTAEHCVFMLSRGGKDAKVIREFNLVKKEFVPSGFNLPESKTDLTWIDENTVLISDGTDPKTLSASGYPMKIRLVQRGQNFQTAPVIFEAAEKSMGAWSYVTKQDGQTYLFVYDQKSFYEQETFYIPDIQKLRLVKLPVPLDAETIGLYKGQYLFTNRSPLQNKSKTYKAGSVFSFAFDQIENKDLAYSVVFTPTETKFYQSTAFSKNYAWMVFLDDVKKSVVRFEFKNGKWAQKKLALGTQGNAGIQTSDPHSEDIYFSYSDFLTPQQYLHLNEKSDTKPQVILRAPERFNAGDFVVHQYKTKSKDGTKIPYFIVHSKKIKYTGQNPTLLYGYGGFEIALTPSYASLVGKSWLEKGGVYVLANIRGGGEYGPDWHKAGLRENRQKVYDDFAAVAGDLFRRKITSAPHLGIKGGSNGGLLTSVSYTQHPELFGAVISAVPLANMMEYHKWLAGASWVAEYGNPDDPKDREFLLKYSPLQNLKKDIKYPEVFYITSTKDDRVHPAHARQMVARLRQLDHNVMYYENTNGGHATSTNMKDYAYLSALEYTYLFQKLFPVVK